MKKLFISLLILLTSISIFGCSSTDKGAEPKQQEQSKENTNEIDAADKAAITSLVESFGSSLQKVSLQAPKDTLKNSMQENYGEFVSPALLEQWLSNPLNAPGRLTSSPWPDSIKVLSIKKMAEDSYEVKGEVIEITSVEKESGGVAARKPITLGVKKIDGKWLINSVELGEYENSNSKVYKNTQYGFSFSLPESWKGYTLLTDKWEGVALTDAQKGKIIETGPMISIRHPKWTTEVPRQDIPIMIFTLDQWKALQEEKFHIGAAPIGPKELARNSKYVFALPARYNYAFPAGYEEVEKILENNPLQANENID